MPMRWKQRIKYLVRRRNKYHLHSPFVFSLATEGLSVNVDGKIKHDIGAYRGELISCGGEISSVPEKSHSALLAKVTKYFHPKKVLCIGSNMGVSMLAMQMSDTICFCDNDDVRVEIMLRLLSAYDIKPQRVTLEDAMSALTSFDMIYVERSCCDMSFLSSLLTSLRQDKTRYICVLDGVHETSDNEVVWDAVKHLEAVNLTLDLYHIGIVFFCPGMEKQHFVLKA